MSHGYESSETRVSPPQADTAKVVASQSRDSELAKFRRLRRQVFVVIAVAGSGLIAWILSHRGEENTDSVSQENHRSDNRQYEDALFQADFADRGAMARDRGNRGPFALFGPDFDVALNMPEVPRYRRLEEAIQVALDGSMIQITGRGPFVVEPSLIEGRHLRIVAAADSHPVLVLSDALGDQRKPMFETDASLILEGLELRAAQFHQPSNTQNPQPLIWAHGPELRLTHCRLRGGAGSPSPLIRADVVECRLSHCEVYSGRGVGLAWAASICGQLVCENNIFAGWSAIQVECPTPPPPDTNVELTHNTCVNQFPLQIHFAAEAADTEDIPLPNTFLRVSAESNLFDARQSVLGVAWQNEPSARGTVDDLSRAVQWTKDRDNVYSVSDAWISQQLGSGAWAPLVDSPRTPDSWADSWGLSAIFASRASVIGFARAGLSQHDFQQATNLTTADFLFRLSTETAELPGADIDHVGPEH